MWTPPPFTAPAREPAEHVTARCMILRNVLDPLVAT